MTCMTLRSQAKMIGLLLVSLSMMMLASPVSAQLQLPGGVERGLPGAVLNHDVQMFRLQQDQPYLNSPINPEGKKTFIPEEPEIIYDESLKRCTQIQGQIMGPDPIISAPEP